MEAGLFIRAGAMSEERLQNGCLGEKCDERRECSS